MEYLPNSLFRETKVTLPSASPGKDFSNNNVPSSSSDTCAPNSSSDAILPPSSFNSSVSPSFPIITAPPNLSNAPAKVKITKSVTMEELVDLLYDFKSREDVLTRLRDTYKCTHEACKSKTCQELAMLLWNSFGITVVLIQELLAVYDKLSPMKVTPEESNRVCNVLALFQVMAAHPEVKMGLVKAKIPVYVYPFLSAVGDDKPTKHMKLASLGVIGALVKCEEPAMEEVVHFLLETEIFPLCLGCMDNGDLLAKEVSTFILLKILMQDQGLKYCCYSVERFFSTVQVLGRLVNQIAENSCERLLKYVICCYVRLSESQCSTDALKSHFPPQLRDDTFIKILHDNPDIKTMLQQLFSNMIVGFRPVVPKPKQFEFKGLQPKEVKPKGPKSKENGP